MKILLSQIEEGAQVRTDLDFETVQAYAERMGEGVEFPPIIVFSDGEKKHLADGFHRVEAARDCGFLDIEAMVEEGTARDALWYALGANNAHGLRMTRADVRKAIGLALQEFPDRSSREIARQIGCDHKTVEAARRTQETGGEIPHVDARVGADGKSYPVRREPEPEPVEDAEPEGAEETEQADAPEVSQADAEAESTGKKIPKATGYAPSNGLQFSRMAILDLEQIRADDKERKQAFAELNQWLADNAPDVLAKSSGKGRVEDPSTAMRTAWKAAKKSEREAFMVWATGRGSDLPKGDYRAMYATTKKLIRLIQANPSLRGDARCWLADVLEGGAQ